MRSSRDKSTHRETARIDPDQAADYYAYCDYIKACVEALVSEFGLAEVRTWILGVLTEFENQDWFEATDDSPVTTADTYFKLYDYTVAALESAVGAD